jgi:ribosomal protein L18E|tara:strand:+ start:10805 stop:10945 length:141 start_codon:yes stop_codon:yes gene_type:complete
MTLAKWEEAVHVAKIRMNLDPGEFTVIKGKLLKEAQIVYKILLDGA